MASRTSGKGSPSSAGASKQPAGRAGGAARKAPAKKAPAKKAGAPPGKAPVKKAAAKKAAPKPAPSPTNGVYRMTRALWLGLAHGVGALFRGVGRGARGLDPAHRKDGVALLLLGLGLVVAAGTWSNLRGPVGDLIEMLVTGTFGRLDLVVPILLGVIAVRLIRHPEKPEANGRIVIGLSALVIGVLGQVHIACGSPGRGEGTEAIQDAGGLIGWGASKPLVFMVGEVLAVPLLILLTIFGLLVVTATPVNSIPQRVRLLGVKLGLAEPLEPEHDGHRLPGEPGEYDEEWREGPARRRRRTSMEKDPQDAEYGPGHAEEAALSRRRRPRRASVQAGPDRPMDAVDVAAAAAAALDGAVLHGVQPSPLVAGLSSGISTERGGVPP
ncbi:cell division protein FtsK, partial [Streptomyces sp. H27-D2]|nr:cell division protein FtsK [Streptomyces sp. H27-D2]